jgi:hypothetical protein
MGLSTTNFWRALRRQRLMLIIPILALTGCNEKIEVYEIPKEDYSKIKKLVSAPTGAASASVKWKAPAHWTTQEATGMRQGSFLVKKGESTADISITSFPGAAGSALANVNRWRGQLELSPLSDQELKLNNTLQVQGRSILIWDMVSKKPLKDQKALTRTLGAILQEADRSWFFKMMGDDKLVKSEEVHFVTFLKNLQFESSSTEQAPPTPSEAPQSTQASWKTPAAWKEIPASGIRRASFQFAGKDAQSGEVSIVVLKGTGGGPLANINLWREQLKLEPLLERDFEKNIHGLKVNGKAATLIDFVSQTPINEQKQKVRIIAAIVPLADETWFIKMTGEDALLKNQKTVFLKFLESIKFSEAK